MKIYIASSWKNQHGVEMLTKQLREQGHEVISWIENNYGENHNHVTKKFDFETWVNTSESDQSFEFDTNGAMTCDLFIYYGPAGMDAAAECGMFYGFRKNQKEPVGLMFALWAKGENFGLMRKMFDQIFRRVEHLLDFTLSISGWNPENPYNCFNRRPHPMDFGTKEEFQERLKNWEEWEAQNG